jgi:hypothetical protein
MESTDGADKTDKVFFTQCATLYISSPVAMSHSREGGNPVPKTWIPAFAGMTFSFLTAAGTYQMQELYFMYFLNLFYSFHPLTQKV